MAGKAPTLEEMLQAPFSGDEIKQREGRAGLVFDYIDSRTAMQRLDEVLGLSGWEFRIRNVIGDNVLGSLTVYTPDGPRVHEDVGYPNGPNDEEPLKSAVSDALKRCAVHVGIGRHLYFDAVPHAAPQRAPKVVQGDGSWVCPVHGADKVRDKGKGLFCAGKMDDGSWCSHNERESKPVEPRPKPAPPSEPEGLMDDLPF